MIKIIKSKGYNIGSYRIKQTSLSCHDDKKLIFKDGYSRL